MTGTFPVAGLPPAHLTYDSIKSLCGLTAPLTLVPVDRAATHVHGYSLTICQACNDARRAIDQVPE